MIAGINPTDVFQMRSMGIYGRSLGTRRVEAVFSVARLPMDISGWA